MTGVKVATRPPTPQERMQGALEKLAPALSQIAAKHIDAHRLVKVVAMACAQNPQLFDCAPKSVMLSVLKAAEMGLEVGGGFGHAYLVPYRKDGRPEAQLVVGYQGYIELIYRTGHVSSIRAANVFEGDAWEYAEGTTPLIVHRPDLAVDRDESHLLYAYAVAHMKSGGPAVQVVMTKKEIDGIRKRSASGNSSRSPWVTDYLQMAVKSPLRRLSKMLPKSRELAQALDVDENPEPETVSEWQEVVDKALDGTPEPETPDAGKAGQP